MKKRILSVFLSLMLIVGMLPVISFADDTTGATDTWAVKLKVAENTELQYNGNNVLELSYAVQSNNLSLKNLQHMSLAVDLDIFDFVYVDSGKAASMMEVVSETLSGDQSSYSVYGKYSTGSGLSAVKWDAKTYSAKSSDGKTGYVILQPYCTTSTPCVSEIELASILIGFKAGKSKADLTEDSVRFMTADEAYSFSQSSVVSLTDGNKNSQSYLPDSTAYKTLTVTPVVDWGTIKFTPTCTTPTGLTATYGQTLADVTLPAAGTSDTPGTWAWKDSTQSVGNVGTNKFTAVFTPTDTDKYETVEAEVEVKVRTKTLTDVAVADIADQYVTGSAITPEVTVTGDGGKTLTKDKDYTVTYSDNTAAGTATVTVSPVTGGNYTFDAVTKNFKINEVKATSITIKTAPSKISYIEGQTFDTTGTVLTVTYNNGTTEEIKAADFTSKGVTCTSDAALATTDKSVTFTYSGQSVTQAITVVARVVDSIAVTTAPTKTSYIEGQKFDPAGTVITATYNDGSTETVNAADFTSKSVTYTLAAALSTTDKSVTFTYSGKTATQTITVVARVVDSIKITTAPTKTSYIEGQTFDPAGTVITATYNDGSTETVNAADFTSKSVTYTPADALATTDSSVTFTYSGKTAAQAITVVEKSIESIAVTTAPADVDYVEGEIFDPAGMVITVTYDNGNTETIAAADFSTKNVTYDKTSALTTEDTAVTFTYSGKTVTQAITVGERPVESISVKTAPDDVEYIEGQTFDPAGTVIEITYSNGDKEEVAAADFDTKGVTYDKTGKLTVSDSSVTFTYREKTAEQPITVKATTVKSFEATSQPAKTEYYTGDELDLSGLEITIEYDNGTTEKITDFTDGWTISGYDSTKAGEQTVTLEYDKTGNEMTFEVTVTDKKVAEGEPALSETEITYGDSLASIDIYGSMEIDGEEVPGTFTWNDPDAEPDAADSYGAEWTFTPDDQETYAVVTGTSVIKVNKAVPTGTPAYTTISESGKTLADAELSIGTIDPADGTLSWSQSTDTEVTANTNYTWTYTPADTKNYETLTGTVKLWTRSSSSGTSSGSNTHSVTIGSSENGSVSASPKNASAGATVTLTAKPDDGYVVDSITVTDGNGNEVALTETGEGVYTFEMPSTAVTVKAAFKEEGTGDSGTSRYDDVAATDWYNDVVEYVSEKGIMNGTADRIFSPSLTTTRGMIATMLYRLAGSPAVSGSSGFTDVASGAYYTDAVTWAAANGYVTGYGDGTFGPEDMITREQLAAILYRYAGSPESSTDLSTFADADDISSYAVNAFKWAVEKGIMEGSASGSSYCLNPVNNATRAETAAMFARYMQMSEEAE